MKDINSWQRRNEEGLLVITREDIESGKYIADEGVVVMVAPEGKSTTTFIRKNSSEVLFNRHPQKLGEEDQEEAPEYEYRLGPLYISQIQ